MYSLGSLLDWKHAQRIEAIYGELAHRFNIQCTYMEMYPHVAYAQAAECDVMQCESWLHSIARHAAPFQLRTVELRLCCGSELGLVIAPNPHLNQLYNALRRWPDAVGALPNTTTPYIPLASGSIVDKRGIEVKELFEQRGLQELAWDVTIDNICLFYDGDVAREIVHRFDLGTSSVLV